MMKRTIPHLMFAIAVGLASAMPDPIPLRADGNGGAVDLNRKLEESLELLAAVRKEIADEKIPLAGQLNGLENELMDARKEYDSVKRQLDRRNLDMNNMRNEIKSREQEKSYLSSLLGEYIRNMESRLHISELGLYQDGIRDARLAPENTNLKPADVFNVQAGLIETSLRRLEGLLGGVRFRGHAAGEDGLVKHGNFVLLGPVAYFAADDGSLAGVAEQRIGSLEPSVTGYANPEFAGMTRQFVADGRGMVPLDGSLGNARKVEETRETLREHIEKGGFMMYPIIAVAIVTLAYSLGKLVSLGFLCSSAPSEKKIGALIEALGKGDREGARTAAESLRGPIGVMLQAGVECQDEDKDLIEEAMFEKMLDTRHRLRGFVPFVAVSAASAPLMGLLGTVLGIINTFKMLTVFGSGDVKQLSGGISEALITTEAGLVLAIPALTFHALLIWLTKGYTDKMEKLALSALSAIEKARRGVKQGAAQPRATPAALETDQ